MFGNKCLVEATNRASHKSGGCEGPTNSALGRPIATYVLFIAIIITTSVWHTPITIIGGKYNDLSVFTGGTCIDLKCGSFPQ